MYAKSEKPKENKSRAVANSVSQQKSRVRQGFGATDNKPISKTQKSKPLIKNTINPIIVEVVNNVNPVLPTFALFIDLSNDP